jgi:integrase
MRKVRQPPQGPDRERCLTADELARLRAACQWSGNPHLYPLVEVLLSTATRKNEVLQRTWAHLVFARGILQVPRSKNGERRAIPILARTLALLEQQRQRVAPSPWVFPRRDGLRPAYIDHAWRVARAKAGLPDLHLHDLRHTSASYLAMSGANIKEIQEILGHKNINQTMKYMHLVEPHTRGVMERMAEQFLEVPGAPRPVATSAARGDTYA